MSFTKVERTASQHKQELRKTFRHLRKKLNAKDRAQETSELTKSLIQLIQNNQIKNIAVYQATSDELNLQGVVDWAWKHDVTTWFPKCGPERQLTWHQMNQKSVWEEGPLGISEPDDQLNPPGDLSEKSLVLLPGLAFYEDGSRLGQGGGYYDRFLQLERSRQHVFIGVGYSCQYSDHIPVEQFDEKCDGVLLADRWIKKPQIVRDG